MESTVHSQFPMAGRFAVLAEHLNAAGGVEDLLARLVTAAAHLIEDTDLASVSLATGDGFSTAAGSHQLAQEVDELQYDTGEGPCVLAARGSGLPFVECPDLSAQTQWPAFGPLVAELGIRAVLCLGLFPGSPDGQADLGRPDPPVRQPAIGTLNLYAYRTHAFDADAVELGLLLAAHAAVALSSVRRASQLREALLSRDVIGQAKGILMERRKLTAEQAFDVLCRTSQRLNMKLRDVAARIADTGAEPRPSGPG